jgi:TonB family protein
VQQPFQFSLARKPVDSTARGRAANRTDAASKPVDAASKPVDAASEPADAASEPADAASEPADAASKPADAYFEFQVEEPAAMRPGPSTMMYPPMLRSAEVEGSVLASFVVDELGVVDLSTFKVLKSDHELFTHAVRTALAEMRFVPAEVGGRKVKQLVQQPFVFRIPK